jgi:hypothetical protein
MGQAVDDLVLARESSSGASAVTAADIPIELKSFAEPLLLPGESLREFKLIRNMIVAEVRPESVIEWLWTFDLVELSWEIIRYRRLKIRVIEAKRAPAVEALLVLVDGEGMPAEAIPMVHTQARRARADWRADPKAAAEIGARLERGGLDQDSINTEAFVQAHELFLMLDQLMHSAQTRRMTLLREIGIRRESARRARRTVDLLERD